MLFTGFRCEQHQFPERILTTRIQADPELPVQGDFKNRIRKCHFSQLVHIAPVTQKCSSCLLLIGSQRSVVRKLSLDRFVAFWFASLVGHAWQSIDEKKLSNWKPLDDFGCHLAKVAKTAAPKARRPGGAERKLLQEDYFSLMLFGLFIPVLTSTRGLCAASRHRDKPPEKEGQSNQGSVILLQ